MSKYKSLEQTVREVGRSVGPVKYKSIEHAARQVMVPEKEKVQSTTSQ